LYSRDPFLVRRVSAFLRELADLQIVQSAGEMERAVVHGSPSVLLIDLRDRESRFLLEQAAAMQDAHVCLVFGVTGSEPMREAESMGIFAAEDINTDRQHLFAQVSRAIDHLKLREENRILRTTPSPAAAPPAAAPAPRLASRMPLPHFSRAFRHFEDVDALLDGIVDSIATSMMVSRAGVFARSRSQGPYRLRAGLRCLAESERLEYDERSPLVHWLEIHAHLVSRSNLAHVEDTAERLMLRQALDALGAEIILPFHARGKIIGWLFVGHRATGLPFDHGDLEDLLVVAEHSATALENALLHEEVALQKTLAETLLQSMPTGIVAIDTEGRVQWFNYAGARILGRAPEDVLRQPVEQLGTQIADILRRTLKTGDQPQRAWVEARTHLSVSAESRRLMDGVQCLGAVVLIQDRTAEKLLREKEEHAERAVFWAELAASMSHEVRNPLVAIKTFAQLLPERYEDPEFRSSFSELVSKEVDRLNRIIEQINDFAHPPKLDLKPVDLNKLLKKAIDLAGKRVERNGVRLESSLDRPLPEVQGDESALTECFTHLITNAVEATRQKSNGQVSVSVAADQNSNGHGLVTVRIRDNGSGIPAEIREKVFSPFCTTKARGMGLGLPIARRTVVDHNGQVEIRTNEKGTEVMVSLPKSNGMNGDS